MPPTGYSARLFGATTSGRGRGELVLHNDRLRPVEIDGLRCFCRPICLSNITESRTWRGSFFLCQPACGLFSTLHPARFSTHLQRIRLPLKSLAAIVPAVPLGRPAPGITVEIRRILDARGPCPSVQVALVLLEPFSCFWPW